MLFSQHKIIPFFLASLLLAAAPQAEAKGHRTSGQSHHGRGHTKAKKKKKKGAKKPENMGPADVPPPEKATP